MLGVGVAAVCVRARSVEFSGTWMLEVAPIEAQAGFPSKFHKHVVHTLTVTCTIHLLMETTPLRSQHDPIVHDTVRRSLRSNSDVIHTSWALRPNVHNGEAEYAA